MFLQKSDYVSTFLKQKFGSVNAAFKCFRKVNTNFLFLETVVLSADTEWLLVRTDPPPHQFQSKQFLITKILNFK